MARAKYWDEATQTWKYADNSVETRKAQWGNLIGDITDQTDLMEALEDKEDVLTFDSTPTAGSSNPVTSDGIKSALDGKQGMLTFDAAPTAGSSNPVKSGGVYSAVEDAVRPLINQWDEQWEVGGIDFTGQKAPNDNAIRTVNLIKIKPSTQYYQYIASSSMYKFYYDVNKQFIEEAVWSASGVFTTPSTAEYMMFQVNTPYGTTYNHDISINYPSTYTGYYPSALPKEKADRANNEAMMLMDGYISPVINGIGNYRDGNVYHKRIGRVDLGTLNFVYYDSYQVFNTTIPNIKAGTINLKSTIYSVTNMDMAGIPNMYMTMHGGGTLAALWIKNTSYTDAAAFKTAMQGAYLYYELATEVIRNIDGGEIGANVSNRNLLDNPWFINPINQRGQSSYQLVAGYTIDRWMLGTPWGTIPSTVTVGSDYVRLAVNALPDYPSAYNALNQIFESELISGKIYTASIKVRAVTGDCSLQVRNGNDTVASVPVSGSGIFSITFTSTGVEDRIVILAIVGCSIDVESVKLELSPVSTLANDAPPNYATELAKCQRYFIRYKGGTNANFRFSMGMASTATNVVSAFHTPCDMRANPIITYGNIGIYNGSTKTVTDVQLLDKGSNIVNLNFISTGLTAGNAFEIRANNSANAFIDLSADL